MTAPTAAAAHAGSDLVPVRRALISVSDKTGLAEFATALVKEFGVELISTGGTAKFLRDAGLTVTDVSEVTGFPEMMDGRVKTLHPKVHGGLLALRDHPEHAAAMAAHDIKPIDLVVINLYPFKKTVEKPGVTFEEAIENIDIGGPSMVRSAAKNHRYVLVVTSPDRYEKALGDLRKHNGSSCAEHRLKQAQRAFAHTAEYDTLIAGYLKDVVEKPKAAAASAGGGAEAVPQRPSEAHRQSLVQRLLDSTAADLPAFLNELLTTQAVTVGGTEAAGFKLEPGDGGAVAIRPVAHVRPDEATAQARAAAIAAFQDLIKPCAEQNRDGAIEVAAADASGQPQYCLITLLRAGGVPVAATAVIARCPGAEQARQRLISMQLVGGYFELFAQRHPNEPAIRRARVASAAEVEFLPEEIDITLVRKQKLRYGENPHQEAALYVEGATDEANVANAKQHHGKELSYINLLDADAALNAVKEFAAPAACIVKHATPCGYATAADLPTAFKNAFAGDPLAAFGGIVALNKPVDLATAQAITAIDKLLEVVVAPSYAPDALDLLKTRWKNVRLLEVGEVKASVTDPHTGIIMSGFDRGELMLHKIVGGYLVQARDLAGVDESQWKVVSQRQPTEQELVDLKMAWLAAKHVKSNAIAIAKGGMMLGSGAGQQDRVNACRIAIAKAGDRVKGSAAGSDAFFPFPDGPELLLNAGVTAIIHPGGSVKDKETIDLVNSRGATMVLTGQRHFRH